MKIIDIVCPECRGIHQMDNQVFEALENFFGKLASNCDPCLEAEHERFEHRRKKLYEGRPGKVAARLPASSE